MERRVIHNHHHSWLEQRAQHFLQPGVEDTGVAGAIEQHRCAEALADARRNQAGAWATMAGAKAVHQLAAHGIAVGAFGGWRKAALIKVDEGCLLLVQLLPAAQKALSLISVF